METACATQNSTTVRSHASWQLKLTTLGLRGLQACAPRAAANVAWATSEFLETRTWSGTPFVSFNKEVCHDAFIDRPAYV